MTPLTGDQPCHKAATYTGQHKQNKRRQTSMPRVGSEPKTIHVLDHATDVIGIYCFYEMKISIILLRVYMSAGLLSHLFHSGSLIKIVYAFSFVSMSAIWPSHIIFLHFITLIISGE
jgi:hypothetical protein